MKNEKLEQRILGYIAKYQKELSVDIYAINIQANHIHIEAEFPLCNRAKFEQHVNARIAEGVRFYVDEFPGGPVFQRRYTQQDILDNQALEDRFFYTALQPVSAGLCEKISDYPNYNSFHDAANQIIRSYKVIDWAGFNKKRKYNSTTSILEFTRHYRLNFKKLPQYQSLSKEEYRNLLHKKLEERRLAIISQKKETGFLYPNPQFLKKQKPGSLPRSTKKSRRHDKLPRYFSSNHALWKKKNEERKLIYDQYKKASSAYLGGDEFVVFPPNTYKPPRFLNMQTSNSS
ncbi:MAG: hypothetical protein IT292_06990 [Deltaproteobacteria bacterium]|nr:hypothetical protein [Deltaproteobacteria bacterium]